MKEFMFGIGLTTLGFAFGFAIGAKLHMNEFASVAAPTAKQIIADIEACHRAGLKAKIMQRDEVVVNVQCVEYEEGGK